MTAPAGDPFASNQQELRQWVDSTGRHHVVAKLVAVLGAETVRLIRPDGRYVRVAFDRLSTIDQRYVRTRVPAVAMSW
jgi:hypothetical protein